MKTVCMVAHIWNCTNSQTVQTPKLYSEISENIRIVSVNVSLLLQITHTFAWITYSLILKIICSLVIVEQPFLFFLNGMFLLVMRVMYKLKSILLALYYTDSIFSYTYATVHESAYMQDSLCIYVQCSLKTFVSAFFCVINSPFSLLHIVKVLKWLTQLKHAPVRTPHVTEKTILNPSGRRLILRPTIPPQDENRRYFQLNKK